MALNRAGAYGVGLLAAAVAVAGHLRKPSSRPSPPSPTPAPRSPAAPPAPPLIAYIYQLPNELAIRMAIGTSPKTAREMGIFQTERKAREVAAARGARLAWQGVKEL